MSGAQAVRQAIAAEVNRRLALVPRLVAQGMPFDAALHEAIFEFAASCLLQPRVLCLITSHGAGLSLRAGVQMGSDRPKRPAGRRSKPRVYSPR